MDQTQSGHSGEVKTPTGKALWFIESHFGEDISLADIAEVAGVSRTHMSRLFGEATGQTLKNYLRSRRLSEAARQLALGAPDILEVALEAGYASHEAFTRAFRAHFGLTPESLRSLGDTQTIPLTEAMTMEEALLPGIEPVRFEISRPMWIAGLVERYDCQSSSGIPAQWQRFVPHIGSIPGQMGSVAYGVRYHFEETGKFDYLCGVEVSQPPTDWARVRIEAQQYAVFVHSDHISTVRRTCNSIWNQWLPQSGYRHVEVPDFERYDHRFNGHTGLGGLEIWMPVQTEGELVVNITPTP